MTAKEKAQELIEMFLNANSMKMSDYSRIEYPTAKACALICVDEIITDHVNLDFDLSEQDERIAYWREVKKEIENL